MTIDEMRAELGLGSDVPDETVVQLYGEWVLGDAEAAPLLPLDELKAFLRVDGDDEDLVIAELRLSAIGQVEKLTGHLLTPRAVTETFCGFERMVLASWPVMSIVGVAYVAADGAAGALDAGDYRLIATPRPAMIARALAGLPSASPWPAAMRGIADAVTATLQAGYAEPGDVPAQLIQAVRMLIVAQFDDRATGGEAKANEAVAELCRPYRRFLV